MKFYPLIVVFYIGHGGLMGATLMVLEYLPEPDAPRRAYPQEFWIPGVNGLIDCPNISAMSVTKLEALGERFGISAAEWPFYHDIEIEADVPIEDVQRKCEALRSRIILIQPSPEDDAHWLDFLRDKVLARGWFFFVMAI